MATPTPLWNQCLVHTEELEFAEFVFRVNSFNPLSKGTKRRDHKDKWFSISDREALWVIINALANTCGGVIDIRTISGDPVKDLDLDDLQLYISEKLKDLYHSCLTMRNEANCSFLIVRKSDVFISAKSHMYTRGLAQNIEVSSFTDLSPIVSQPRGKLNVASCLFGQSLVYKGICTLIERKEVEFKHFKCSRDELVERITKKGDRCEKTLFALPNLPNGGFFIIGVEEDKSLGKNVFLGVDLDEADKKYILEKLSKFMQVDSDGIPRVWGKLLHTDIKEDTHWFCKFIPLTIPTHTCDGPPCTTCPSKRERCLIEIYVPHCPGGVFLRKPEAFALDEEGTIHAIEFDEWLKIHQQSTLSSVPLATSTSQSQPPISANQPSTSNNQMSPATHFTTNEQAFCEDHVTLKFSAHGSHKTQNDTSDIPHVVHPEKFDLFKMSRPINYTPPEKEIESVLSGNSLLQTIDKAVDHREAFGVAATSLFSCIKHSMSVERPPHHLMDVLVVNKLAAIVLFVVCSTFGSHDDQMKQRAYSMSLGRILKMKIMADSKHISVVVQCQILDQSGLCFRSSGNQLEWFPHQGGTCQICLALVEVLRTISNHFSRSLMRDVTFEFSEEQLITLQNITRNRFNFIEGPPGCGKTLLAQSICERHEKEKSVYISKSRQLTNFVNHKGCVNAKCVVESDLFTEIEALAQDIEHIVIDDAQNMCCSEQEIKKILDYCQKKNKRLYVFQDSRYQNFQDTPEQMSFEQVYNKGRKQCIYTGGFINTLEVIRRNSDMVGSYITALIPDITPNHQVQCESHVPGDDVIVKHVENLRSEEDNGLVAHVKRIVSEPSVDPQDEHYAIQDVAILIDHSDTKTLAKEVIFFKQVFQTDWPESCVQSADQFPVQGVIIDSLHNFIGLEARVVVFVVPEITSTDAVRSISNPKYKLAIASRGIDRVDFVQDANLEVEKLKDFKFDNISTDLLQPQDT